MDNIFDTVRAAMQQAKATFQAADNTANQMATLLTGRLRKVDRYTLRELKRELTHFDAVKGKWKD